MTRLDWQHAVLPHAAEIVWSYDTGVTLRQLFYRLVADGTLPNLQSYYRNLSHQTSLARRAGEFPDLLDRTSRIERWASFDGPADAMEYLIRDLYRRDRTEGQEWTVYLGVEKAGLSTQLDAWFGDGLGVPIVALGGYASQTLCTGVRRDIEDQDRPAVLIYAGDMDPTGEDIDRDFVARVASFDQIMRVALQADQVTEYNLVSNPDPVVINKLSRDTRARAFMQRHGIHRYQDLVQYEVDALPPETLRDLYQTAIEQFWDTDAHAASVDRENAERDRLAEILDELA